MKRILLFITTVLLFASFINSKAQPVHDWSWSFPKPTGATLRWCQMFDANTYYVIGYNGVFGKTTNGGTTWKFTAPGSPSGGLYGSYGYYMTLYDAHFFNMNTGIVCGSYGSMIRTTDAGVTWDSSNVGTTPTLYDLHFINNNTGFVSGSTTRDVSKTTDGGLTWTDISGNIAGSSKYCIYAWDVNNIIVGTSSADLYKTTNGGTNWTAILNTGGTVYKIAFMNATTGFMVGSSTMVQKTTNGGNNWTVFSTVGIPSSTFYDVDFGPAGPSTGLAEEQFTSTTFPPTGWLRVNVLGTTQWVRSTGQSHSTPASAYIGYQSTGGEDWLITKQFPNASGDSLVFWWKNAFSSAYPPDSLIIRLSTTTSAIGSFTNIIAKINGATAPYTWTRHAYALPFSGNVYVAFQHKNTDGNGGYLDDVAVNGAPSAPTVYVTGNPFYVYKSPTTAPSWDTLGFLSPTQPVTTTYYSTSLAANGDSLLTVGAFGLINKRNNASNTQTFRPDWTWFTSRLGAVEVLGNKVMIPSSYSTILSSTDGGTNWDTSRVNYSYSGTLYSISKVNNTTAWVGGSNGRTYSTTNAGTSWTESTNNTTLTIYNVNFPNANTGWLFASGAAGGIEKTTDGGTTWVNQTATGVTSTIYGSSFIDANTGWLVGNTGKVSKTTDGGATWVAQTSNTTATLRNIDMINANTGWFVGLALSSQMTCRGTTDGGTTWDTLALPYTSVSLYGVDFVDQWNGMLTGSYGWTFRTRDGGTTWIMERTGGISQYGVKMTSTDSGWACSSSGYVFKYSELLNNGNTYTHIVPEKYTLSQNYPNPFNPTTTIQFGLPKAGRVSLKIYDVSGRLVRTLVNNEGLNEGTFKYIFNGSDIASGVYFYSLIVNDNLVGTKKMVLVK